MLLSVQCRLEKGGGREGVSDWSREQIGLGSQQSSKTRMHCFLSVTPLPTAFVAWQIQPSISGRLNGRDGIKKRLRRFKKYSLRSLCMMRHVWWEDFRSCDHTLLTLWDVTRPRSRGQIKHPLIKCPFPLEMTRPPSDCPLSEYLPSLMDNLKSDLPHRGQRHCTTACTIHSVIPSFFPSPFKADEGYLFNIAATVHITLCCEVTFASWTISPPLQLTLPFWEYMLH